MDVFRGSFSCLFFIRLSIFSGNRFSLFLESHTSWHNSSKNLQTIVWKIKCPIIFLNFFMWAKKEKSEKIDTPNKKYKKYEQYTIGEGGLYGPSPPYRLWGHYIFPPDKLYNCLFSFMYCETQTFLNNVKYFFLVAVFLSSTRTSKFQCCHNTAFQWYILSNYYQNNQLFSHFCVILTIMK